MKYPLNCKFKLIIYLLLSLNLVITSIYTFAASKMFLAPPDQGEIVQLQNALKENQLISEFEQNLKDKLSEFITISKPRKEQLKEEIVEFLIININGLNGGIGIVNMTSTKAREWQEAALSNVVIALRLKEISGVDLEWYDELALNNLVYKKKIAFYGDLLRYFPGQNEADFYHVSASFLLDYILTNGILSLNEIERRKLDIIMARSSSGGAFEPDVVSLSFDFDECLAFQIAGTNRLMGYLVVFGVSEEGTKKTFVRDIGDMPNKSKPLERQVKNIDIKDVTHIYVPTMAVEEVKEKLKKQKIDWIQVVDMQSESSIATEPSLELRLLSPGQKVQNMLIVDDTEIIINNLEVTLRQIDTDIDIKTHYDAGLVLEEIRRQIKDEDINSLFDLIATDKDMPLMQGDRFINELRTLGYKGPIVLMTLNPYDLEKRGFVERRNHPTDNPQANYWHYELTPEGVRELGHNTIVLHKIESSYEVFPKQVKSIVTLLNKKKSVTKNDLEPEGMNFKNSEFVLQVVDKLLKEKWDLTIIQEIISCCKENQRIAKIIVQRLFEYAESRRNAYKVRERAANLMERLGRAGIMAAIELETVVGFLKRIQDLDEFKFDGRTFWRPNWYMCILNNVIINNSHLVKDNSFLQLMREVKMSIEELKQIDQGKVPEELGRKICSAISYWNNSFASEFELAKIIEMGGESKKDKLVSTAK